MELRMQYATAADGVRIAYAVAGSGPWLVRLPGLPFSHTQMEWANGSDFFDGLIERWTVVPFDPRGCGLSDRGVADLSLRGRILDLEAIVDKLELDRFALHVVGWSAPVAITYAAENPERLTHLILDDAAARVTDIMALPQFRAANELTGEWETLLDYVVSMFYGIGRAEGKPYKDYLHACVTPEDGRRILQAVRQDDAAALLASIQTPTLIVQHSGNAGGGLNTARDMAARIPDAHLVVLEGQALDDTNRILGAMDDLLGRPREGVPEPHEHHHDLETSVRAVLFTDFVGHTEMMARQGDERGRNVLREHERITRDILREHAGTEVKTMGDGFMASFGSVTRSVECAIALQRAFEVRSEQGGEPIRVRIGLNAGEPIAEEQDLFGWSVILSSRIAAAAEGGEILASDVVRALCSGKGFLFADRGEFIAKGFEEPVRLYQVKWTAEEA